MKLNANEASIVLLETVKGAIALCGFAGSHFVMVDKMIGFNEEGRVKVWLDDNFGNQEIQQASLARNEEETVKSIIKIFSSRIGILLNWHKIATLSKLMAEAESLTSIHSLIQDTSTKNKSSSKFSTNSNLSSCPSLLPRRSWRHREAKRVLATARYLRK